MIRYVTYKRVSTKEQGRSGLGLEAQERDIRLFLSNFSDEPWEVVVRPCGQTSARSGSALVCPNAAPRSMEPCAASDTRPLSS